MSNQVDILPGGSIPWDDIEPGILPIVKILNSYGIPTLGSCEGHRAFPWITCQWVENPNRIADILYQHGITGFSILQIFQYVSAARPHHCLRHIRIEFWEPVPQQ